MGSSEGPVELLLELGFVAIFTELPSLDRWALLWANAKEVGMGEGKLCLEEAKPGSDNFA